MSFSEQLKAARQVHGLTQQAAADQLGIDKTTYSGYETGKRQPDIPKLRAISRLFGMAADDLLEVGPRNPWNTSATPEEMNKLVKRYRVLDVHGRELVDLVLEKEYVRMTRHDDAMVERRSSVTYINCYDLAVSAGTGEPWGDTAYKTRLEIPTERVPENAHYCVRVNGNSMEPAYRDGDLVFVERLEGTVHPGEIGIFFLNGEGYLKRLGDDALISLNPDYPPIPLYDYDSLLCQGRVLGRI